MTSTEASPRHERKVFQITYIKDLDHDTLLFHYLNLGPFKFILLNYKKTSLIIQKEQILGGMACL